MKITREIACAVVVAALWLVGAAVPVSAQDAPAPAPSEKKIVKAIEFQGLKRLRDIAVLPKIETQVGGEYSEEMLSRDMKRLYYWNMFEHVNVFRVDEEGGYRVIFRFVERPYVTQVVVLNNFKIKTEELKKTMITISGAPLKKHTVLIDIDNMKKQYWEKGYGLVDVSYQFNDDGQGGTEVVFNVAEGPKVTLTSVAIKDNRAFTDRRLRSLMETKRKSFLVSAGKFKQDQFEIDMERLTAWYRSRGYLDAHVDLEDMYYVDNFKQMKIQLRVKEGEQYFVGNVEFKVSGDAPDAVPADQLHAAVILKQGDPLLWEKLEKTRKAVKELYGRQGRWFTVVRFRPKMREAENLVDLEFSIEVGEIVHINEIRIKGNYRTQEKVIRRELSVFPGEIFNEQEFNKSLTRLHELNYFEDIRTDLWPSTEPGLYDLIIEVVEKETGALRFGVGFSTDGGISGYIEYSQRNFDLFDWPKKLSDWIPGRAFVGGGQFFSTRFQPGTEFTQYSLRFREPYVWDKNIGYNFSVFSSVGRFNSRADILSTGFSTGFDWRWQRDWRASIGYNLTRRDVFDVSFFAPPETFQVKGVHFTSSLSLGLKYHTVDSAITPSTGMSAGVTWEHAGGMMGGDWDFNKITASTIKYHTLHTNELEQKHVLSWTGTVGWVDEFGDSTFVPITERFTAGGRNSVRGFDSGTIGPKSRGRAVGGKALYLAGVEYVYPVPALGDIVRGVLFVDAGNVAADWSDLETSKTRISVGFGFRVVVPFLGQTPLQLDFGFPVHKEDGDVERMINFGVTTNF